MTRTVEAIQKHLDNIADWRAKRRNLNIELNAQRQRRDFIIEEGKMLGMDKRTTKEALYAVDQPEPFTEAGPIEGIIERAGAEQ